MKRKPSASKVKEALTSRFPYRESGHGLPDILVLLLVALIFIAIVIADIAFLGVIRGIAALGGIV